MRAFIAIDIPVEIQHAVEEAQAELKKTTFWAKVSWTKIANLHLTLQFLGNVKEDAVDPLKSALQAVAASYQAFDVTIQGAGAFPDEKRPRVVWVGCDDEAGHLKSLAQAVRGATISLGFPAEEHEFSAHLTLGRIRSPRPDDALTRAVSSLKSNNFGTLRVTAFHLYESRLHPEGSVYTKLSSHALEAHN